MTRQEIVVILGILKTSYPRFYVNMTKEDAENTIALWQEMFADVDMNLLKIAVKSLIAHFEFPPTIADVRKEIAKLTTPQQDKLTVDEAWGQVIRAISSYGYSRQDEALASMSDNVAKVVRGMGWLGICQSENIDVVRGQFAKWYEASQNRAKEERLIPLEIKNMIQLIQGKDIKMIKGE